MFKKHECYHLDFYQPIISLCSELGIDFCTTCFDPSLLSQFIEYLPYIKISSSDLTNVLLIDAALQYSKPLVISCGASSLSEIQDLITYIRNQSDVSITLLHCVLNYPCPPENANINMITTLRSLFSNQDIEIGYSCHVAMPYATDCVLSAITLGATFIEKHFTSCRLKPGNDHYHAWTAEDLSEFRDKESKMHQFLGSGSPQLTTQESARLNARRSLYLSKNVSCGQVITKDDFIALRPFSNKFSPLSLPSIIGATWTSDFISGTPLSPSMVSNFFP